MFLIIISSIALLVFLFSVDLSWSNLVSAHRNDLIFEGRNRDYGAFVLRREHHMNVFYALLLSIGLIGGGFFAIGALRAKPISKLLPPMSLNIVPLDITPFDHKPDETPKTKPPIKTSMKPAGLLNTEIVVVDDEEEKKDIVPAGPSLGTSDDDGPEGPQAPVVSENGGGGTGDGSGTETKKKTAKRFVKNRPQFPGGDEALNRYMAGYVHYTDIDVQRNVSGTIFITFIVQEDGSISNVYTERSIRDGERLENKALDAINNMPAWIPGDDGAEPLPVIMTMPVKCELRP